MPSTQIVGLDPSGKPTFVATDEKGRILILLDIFAVAKNGEAGSIADGDAVYQSTTDDEVLLGKADALASSFIVGVVSDASIATGASGGIIKSGLLVGAGAGWTAGDEIFLSVTGTSGNTLTNVKPSTPGDIVTKIGTAKNATDLWVNPEEPYVVEGGAVGAAVNGEAGAMARGDAVFQSAVNDEILFALNDTEADSRVVGLVADATIASGDTGNIQNSGLLKGAGGGWTPGDVVYLDSAGTTGATLTTTKPTDVGVYVTKVGVAKNATDLWIEIEEPILIPVPDYLNGEAGALALGDVVYKDAVNDEAKIADASALATSRVIGVATGVVASGDPFDPQRSGVLAGAGAGWTAGNPIYLTVTGTSGNTLSETAPVVAGEVILRIGYAKNATDLEINIGEPTVI